MLSWSNFKRLVKFLNLGSGCGVVGRAVASDTRVHRLESMSFYLLLTVFKK